MFCCYGGVLGPCPPFGQRATTRIAGSLACPYDGDRAGIALFNSQHSATEYAGDSSAVGQDFGQPVTGARMDSGVAHERSLECSKKCGDLSCDLWRDFDFQFHRLAIGL